MGIPRAPDGAGVEGRRLWQSVMRDFELSEHETAILRQAVRVADTCAALQAVVDEQGLFSVSGLKPHPALVELRAQRILLTRLVVALRVPLGDQEQPSKTAPVVRLQRRALRGAYGPRRAS